MAEHLQSAVYLVHFLVENLVEVVNKFQVETHFVVPTEDGVTRYSNATGLSIVESKFNQEKKGREKIVEFYPYRILHHRFFKFVDRAGFGDSLQMLEFLQDEIGSLQFAVEESLSIAGDFIRIGAHQSCGFVDRQTDDRVLPA